MIEFLLKNLKCLKEQCNVIIDVLNFAGIPVMSIKGINGGYGIVEGFRMDRFYINGVMILNIVKATRADSGDIMELIKSCILDMESQGIYQWNEYYPTLDIISDDIEGNNMYVFKEGNSIWGIIVINEDQSPEYSNLRWVCNEGKALVIHRLAVQPKKQRAGIAKKLMDFAENYAKEKEYTSIRLDAYCGNPRALKLYKQRGYIIVGQVYFPMRDIPFNCFEKVL